ncbi:hypothetical protein BCR37DRAFT_394117 [Protomyces lactucae-debilis]|uniref:BHLH domain-containing protein n=1 Tax=Protomyces lactucae-debilis TaxID=2754530 RepID=A0A1Y2F6A9_PROLT|nr:uncharacterized protein BCR37DRAFT_394117 [Protomyces lactucae-debilis]ORY79379.1 hypothetical protein BCR37DRAFT_394117 [Protomyces lactucae-debilis]
MNTTAFDGFLGSLSDIQQEELDAITAALAPSNDEMPQTDTASNKDAPHSLQHSFHELAQQQQQQQQSHQQQMQMYAQSYQKHPHPYPTPNSASMFAAVEKPYMSPFPDPGSAAAMALSQEIDELLFTPMMSPAMGPLHNGFPAQQQEVDWDRFDQSLFALTGPAIDGQVQTPTMELDQATGGLTSPAFPMPAQQQASAPPSAKRQRVARKPSATSLSSKSPALKAISKHKRKTTSMSAPLLRQSASSLEPSPEPNSHAGLAHSDSVSPMAVDFGKSTTNGKISQVQQRRADVAQERLGQPITPSMLMSLSGTLPELAAAPIPTTSAQGQHVATKKPFPTPIATANLPSPTFRPPSQPSTPAAIAPARPIQAAPSSMSGPTTGKKQVPGSVTHSRAGSVANSPALGPSLPRNSPDLRPILPGGMSPQVSALLASKSNYQHILDGTLNQMGVSYPTGMTAGLENRRTSHKQAEQKRRDHLKESFELLRNILPDKLDAGASKVVLLRKGYEYILSCKKQVEEKDIEIARLRKLAGLAEVPCSAATSQPVVDSSPSQSGTSESKDGGGSDVSFQSEMDTRQEDSGESK